MNREVFDGFANAGEKSRERSRLENVPQFVPSEAADMARKVSTSGGGQALGGRNGRSVSTDGGCGAPLWRSLAPKGRKTKTLGGLQGEEGVYSEAGKA